MSSESASRRLMLALLVMTVLAAIFAATVWLRPHGIYLI
jgi:hypothetical protein